MYTTQQWRVQVSKNACTYCMHSIICRVLNDILHCVYMYVYVYMRVRVPRMYMYTHIMYVCMYVYIVVNKVEMKIKFIDC